MDYYWLIGTILTLLGVIIAPFATEINVVIRKVFKKHDKQRSLNVSFEYGGMFSEGILLNYSPGEIYDYEKFKEHQRVIYSYPYLNIIIENPRELESTLIHPFVRVHLLRRVKLPQNVNYYLPGKEGIGGGGGEELPKIFTMVLNSSQKSQFYAPHIEENNESYYFFNRNIDEIQLSKEIIYLKPSGMTYFTVDIEMESGYLYEFTVSVYYKSDIGFIEVKSPEKYRCAVPDSVIALSDFGPTNRMVFDKPLRNRTFTADELRTVDNYRIEELRREIVKAIAKKKYSFPYLRESPVIDTDNFTLSKMR